MPPIYGNIGAQGYDTLVPNALNNLTAGVGQHLQSLENSDQLFDRTVQGVLNRRAQVAAQKRAEAQQNKLFGKQLAVTGGTALLSGGLAAGLGAIPSAAAADAGAVGASSAGVAADSAPVSTASTITPDLPAYNYSVTSDPALTRDPSSGIATNSMGQAPLNAGSFAATSGPSTAPPTLPGSIKGPSMPLPTSKMPQWNYPFGQTAGASAARGFGLGVLGTISPGTAGILAENPAFNPMSAGRLALMGTQQGLMTTEQAMNLAHANYLNTEASGLPSKNAAEAAKNYGEAWHYTHPQQQPGDKLDPHSIQDLNYHQSGLQGDDIDRALGTLGIADTAYKESGGKPQAAEWGKDQFYNLQKAGTIPSDFANPFSSSADTQKSSWFGLGSPKPVSGPVTWSYDPSAMDRARTHVQSLRQKRSSLNPGLTK